MHIFVNSFRIGEDSCKWQVMNSSRLLRSMHDELKWQKDEKKIVGK
jgi:hypothetical protein